MSDYSSLMTRSLFLESLTNRSLWISAWALMTRVSLGELRPQNEPVVPSLLANKGASAFLNNVSYVSQKTPTLYTALSVGEDASSPEVYGQVNPHVIERGQVIEIILNNLTPGHHPFHLHGHHFQVINRLAANAGSFNAWDEELASSPLRRDTIDVNSVSSARIRFRADNPGVWLFHCHLEWHVPMGLVATFIESPFEVQKMIRNIPKSHFEICQEQCYPTKGNAAGNTADHFDLAGATDPHQVPTRG